VIRIRTGETGEDALYRQRVAVHPVHDGRFRKDARRRAGRLLQSMEKARREEKSKFGETVFLLAPNVKRSRGGLRDIQVVRWVGFALHGETDLDRLALAGGLTKEDYLKLRQARDFLLRLRNEMHFHDGKSSDVLTKDEQVRIAELFGYRGAGAVLPVEQFMRDYFAHTSDVRYISSNFLAGVRGRRTVIGLLEPIFSHQVEGDFRVGRCTSAPRGAGWTSCAATWCRCCG
jgi:[protein-PII] uridylyltransferase